MVTLTQHFPSEIQILSKHVGEMFSMFGHQGNSNQNYTEISSHLIQNDIIRKIKSNTVDKDSGGNGSLFTVDKNIKLAWLLWKSV